MSVAMVGGGALQALTDVSCADLSGSIPISQAERERCSQQHMHITSKMPY